MDNQIQIQDINTRKELWDSLFLFVNFQGLKADYPNMWNKDYKLLPLPKSYQETKKKLTKYCKELDQQIENLINSFNNYFQNNIYPLLNKPEGDKTLLFRCDRLLKNKILGESSSLFLDLIIWEIEYRQVEKFKEILRKLNTNPMFLTDQEDENFANDCERLIEGRINYSICQRFFFKWMKLVEKDGQQKEEWQELADYLKLWEQGKGAKSEWKTQLDIFKEQIEEYLHQQKVDQITFSFAKVKYQSKEELKLATQNRKGWDLDNPYLILVWFHQKPNNVNPNYYRVYFVKNHALINTRNLYTELILQEDWVWKNCLRSMISIGSLESSNHPVYHSRNLN